MFGAGCSGFQAASDGEGESEVSALEGREIYVIDTVVHFGGFFQGETVGLNAHPRSDSLAVQTLTIDDSAWDNLKDKHNLEPGMNLLIRFARGEVEEAAVLGHSDRELLRAAAVERNISPNPALRAIAYHCKQCGMWIAQQPVEIAKGAYSCLVCGSPLA
ncbi:MAG: hypothetical protein WKH64_01715 [Chloroflexia bacterium]